MQADSDTQPLDGVTVLDASRVLAGPFCTMQLGDLGAEVIKVERPDGGDQTRGWTPPTYGETELSAYYLSTNRNKRSLTLNLDSEQGREIFRDLAAEADVLVENFRLGTMAEWGVDYEALQERNADLVYCKLSGYGETGPHSERPAYDLVMQAEGGMMSITGKEDGSPVRVGVAMADLAAGMYAAQSVLASLFRREFADAGGERIEVSLFESIVAWQTYMASFYFATGDSPGRMGSRHPTIAPYQAFQTADDWVVVACASEHIWPRLCRALDREDLLDDDRFGTNETRVTNRDALEAILAEEFERYETADVVDLLREYDVPASPVNDMADVFAHPQVEARQLRKSVPHPSGVDVEMPGSPMRFQQAETTIERHPPELGEHTEEILVDLGYTDDDIQQFRRDGIV